MGNARGFCLSLFLLGLYSSGLCTKASDDSYSTQMCDYCLDYSDVNMRFMQIDTRMISMGHDAAAGSSANPWSLDSRYQYERMCIPDLFPNEKLAILCSLFGMAFVIFLCLALRSFSPAYACAEERNPQPRMTALDGLRVIVEIYIMFGYFDNTRSPVFYFTDSWVGSIYRAMYQYTSVMSGFVLVCSVGSASTHFNFKTGVAFLLRRAARIFPAYYVALFLRLQQLTIGIEAGPLSTYPLHAVFSQTLVRMCSTRGFPSWNPQGFPAWQVNIIDWPVANMVICSLCFPLLFNIMPRGKIAIIPALMITILVRHGLTFLFFGNLRLLYISVLPRLPEFFAGMLTAALAREAFPDLHAYAYWGRLFDLSLLVSIGVLLISGPGGWFGLSANSDNDHSFDVFYGDFFLLVPACTTCFTAYFVSMKSGVCDQGIIMRALSWWPVSSLHHYTYFGYLLSSPLADYIGLFQFSLPSRYYCFVPTLIGTSILGTHVLQKPIQRASDSRGK